jgi:hypothetical protein
MPDRIDTLMYAMQAPGLSSAANCPLPNAKPPKLRGPHDTMLLSRKLGNGMIASAELPPMGRKRTLIDRNRPVDRGVARGAWRHEMSVMLLGAWVVR